MQPTKPPDRRRDLFGGVGEVLVWDLLGADAAPPFTAILRCELAPGGHVGRHVQQAFPEIVVGLGGVGEAKIGGIAHRLAVGDVVYLPLGEVLELRNLGPEAPLHYLIVKAREAPR
ncbi:MAG: cupin domain-containing protein [Nannocystaceae bacterium]